MWDFYQHFGVYGREARIPDTKSGDLRQDGKFVIENTRDFYMYL